MKMKIINTNEGISVTKVKMIRPENNPKNCDLDLDVDWAVEYIENDKKPLEYVCTLETLGEFHLKFAVQGHVGLKSMEHFKKIQDDLSHLIMDKSMTIMVNMLNLTRDTPLSMESFSNISMENKTQITLHEFN